MGICVFPVTKKSVNLEMLAGVNFGTIKRLRQFESDHPELFSVDDELAYETWCLMDDELKQLRQFELFGFGKIHLHYLQEILNTEDEAELMVGKTSSPAVVRKILHSFGQNNTNLGVILSEGLIWC